MLEGNLQNGPMIYTGGIAPIMVFEITHGDPKGYGSRPVEDCLRFFYSTDLLQLTTNGSKRFVSERSAIKINPGIETKFEMRNGAKLYEIQINKPEAQILEDLTTKYSSHFDGLTDGEKFKDKTEWDSLSGKDIGYIAVEAERNANRIEKILESDAVQPDKDKKKTLGLVAPTFSRFNHHASSGWNMMYVRGSVGLGIGTEADFETRQAEALHKHLITTEIYLCLGGAVDMNINGLPLKLNQSGFLIAEPGELHTKVAYTETPYYGVTLQLPSIPGDKYTPEGIRTR